MKKVQFILILTAVIMVLYGGTCVFADAYIHSTDFENCTESGRNI